MLATGGTGGAAAHTTEARITAEAGGTDTSDRKTMALL
jgi:hypothetical protein